MKKRNIDDDCLVPAEPGIFWPSRRTVLGGSAAMLVADAAKADASRTESYYLEFVDAARRQFVQLVERSSATETPKVGNAPPAALLLWDRREFGPGASFEIKRISLSVPSRDAADVAAAKQTANAATDRATAEAAKVSEWVPKIWTLAVRNGAFPGNEGRPFRADFRFERLDETSPWQVSATMSRWWSKAPPLVAKRIDLNAFLGAPGQTLAFAIEPDAAGMLKSLFGERIETETALDLRVDRRLHWSIEADSRLNRAKKARLFVLDVPLEFGKLSLHRIRSDAVLAADYQRAEQLSLAAKKPDVPAIAPPPAGDASSASAAEKRLLFDDEVLHGRPSRAVNRPVAPDGLYAELERVTGFAKLHSTSHGDLQTTWAFEIATAQIAGIETAVSVALDESAVTFATTNGQEQPSSKALATAALRHWGYPEHTVAGVVTANKSAWRIGQLNLRQMSSGNATSEGPFEFSGFEIVRQLHADRGVVTTFRATPTGKETTAALLLGGVGLMALPETSSAPGRSPKVPQIEVEAVDASLSRRRVLTKFGGHFSICNAAIALPERLEVAEAADAKVIFGTHATRLEFTDAEAIVYMPAFGAPPSTVADAILPVGPLPKVVAPQSKATFDLGRARLSVIRPSDLLALRFRFSGLELTVPWPPTHNAVSSLAPRGGRAPGRPPAILPGSSSTERDERPLLVVEFPPQHVVERAYLRRDPPALELPQLDAGKDHATFEAYQEVLKAPKHWSSQIPTNDPVVIRWRDKVAKLLGNACGEPSDPTQTTSRQRIALRQKMRALAATDTPLFHDASCAAACKTFADFDRLFTQRMKEAQPRLCDASVGDRLTALPQEQSLYVGPDFLDPDARRIALDVVRELKAQEASSLPRSPTDGMPSVTLDPAEWQSILDPLVQNKTLAKFPDQSWPGSVVEKDDAKRKAIADVLQDVERARERRDSAYAEFRQLYRRLAQLPGNNVPPDLRDYHGRAWLDSVLKTLPDGFVKDLRKALDARDQEPFDEIAPSRISGVSRVAFRVDCEDFEPDRAAGRIPFTLEGLTDWGGMDMAVVRRAERLMETPKDGRLPPRWGRRASNDECAILRYQGLTGSDRWGHETAARDRVPSTAAPGPMQRLAEVYAAAAAPPDAFETAIELPFRLFLSPAQDATWITTSPRVRREAFSSSAACDDVDGFRELWTARLTGKESEAGLRAIWSPDFRPEALLSTMAPAAPPRGPFAPWAIPRSVGLRSTINQDLETFRTALEAYDRHELTILSSVPGLPVLGRRALNGDIAQDADQIEPPPGYRLSGVQPEKIDGQWADMTAIYRPKVLAVSELSLSALGGCLDLDAGFHPPASARLKSDGSNLFDALSVERWRQRTVLGRDIVVEVVYKGYLFPLGHLASLVKLTERRFVALSDCGPPVAVLVQRLLLRVGKRDKRYPAEGQPNRGVRWPCETVTILTQQTPDLVDSNVGGGEKAATSGVFAGGKIDLPNSTGICLWPRTSRRDGAEVWFEMQIGTEAVPVRMPLIFVDNVAANDSATMKALVGYYNANVSDKAQTSPTRYVSRNGQPVVMAPETKAADTSFTTSWWRIKAEGRESALPRTTADGTAIDNSRFDRDSFMEGQDQPAFYPIVDRAYCRLGQVERHTGRSPLWAEVAYDGKYVASGFVDEAKGSTDPADQPEIYLRVLKGDDGASVPLDFADRGDLAGGIARPSMEVVALSRRLGPINGNEKPPAAAAVPAGGEDTTSLPTLDRNRFSPLDALPNAKFLGILNLKDLISCANAIADQLGVHPKLLEAVEYGAASAEGVAAEIRAALTKAILNPALDAVREVEDAWTKLAQERVGNGQTVPDIETVYPQIGQDIKALEKTLESAQDQTTPDVTFFAGLSTIHESARRLVRTIENIARDPLAAAAGAQVELFRRLSTLVGNFRSLTLAFSNLKHLPGKLQDVLHLEVRQAIERQVAALLPGDLDAAERTETGNFVQQSIATVLATEPPVLTAAAARDVAAKLAKVLRDNLATAYLSAAAHDGIEALADRLTAAAEMAAAEQAIADEIQAAPQETRSADVAARAANAADAARDEAIGLIASPPFMVALKLVDAASWESFKTFPTDPKKIPETLSALGPMLEVIATLGFAQHVTNAVQKLADFCTRAKSTLAAAAQAVLPASSLLEIDDNCLKQVEGKTLPSICDGSAPVVALFKAVALTREALDSSLATPDERKRFEIAASGVFAAIGKLAEAQDALNDALDAFGSKCATTSPDLPAQLRATAARQRILIGSLQTLVKTTADIATQYLLPFVASVASKAAFDAAMDLVASILAQVPSITLLEHVTDSKPFKALADRLNELSVAIKPELPETADALADTAKKATDTSILIKGRATLATTAAEVVAAKAAVSATVDDATKRAVAGALNAAYAETLATGDAVLEHVERALAGDLCNILALASAPVAGAIKKLTDPPLPAVAGVLQLLSDAYQQILKQRDVLTAAVSADQGPVINRVLDVLAKELVQGPRTNLFLINPPGPDGTPTEALQHEADLATAASAAAATDVPLALARLNDLAKLLKADSALVTLFKRFSRIDGAFLRVIVVEALDLRALRNQLEQIVRELVPSRATLSYDLSAPTKQFPDSDETAIFIPGSDTRLEIKARTIVDLQSRAAPDARVDGSMGRFGIRLLGAFDFVTLNFRRLEFRAGGGRAAGFDVHFGDIKIGPKAEFLKQLEAYISPKGGPPPVRPMKDKPGIEASYGINLGSFGVGTLSFSNVSLNAGARLPFGAKDEAEFFISIGRSDAPFLISSTIFGGGGYLELLANSNGFIGLQTSFDYGGVFAFGFGPLTGAGQITLGLYFRAAKGESATIGMNFMARGAANIACFGFSTSIFVRLTYAGGKMEGIASYSFSFSFGIDDIEFTFDVHVNQGAKAGQGSTNSALLDLPGVTGRTRYAGLSRDVLSGLSEDFLALAPNGLGGRRQDAVEGPAIRVEAPSQVGDWLGHRSLFDDGLNPLLVM